MCSNYTSLHCFTYLLCCAIYTSSVNCIVLDSQLIAIATRCTVASYSYSTCSSYSYQLGIQYNSQNLYIAIPKVPFISIVIKIQCLKSSQSLYVYSWALFSHAASHFIQLAVIIGSYIARCLYSQLVGKSYKQRGVSLWQ